MSDLKSVVDAAGLERFDLLGISQGCAVSVAYAVRHPERVAHLIIYGGFVVGHMKHARSEAEKEQAAAMLSVVRHGWGQENPAFRQLFTVQFIPGGTKEQEDWFNELQRISISPEGAVRSLIANREIDVSALLAEVTTPLWSCTRVTTPAYPSIRADGSRGYSGCPVRIAGESPPHDT